MEHLYHMSMQNSSSKSSPDEPKPTMKPVTRDKEPNPTVFRITGRVRA